MVEVALNFLRGTSSMLIPHMPWRGSYGRAEFIKDVTASLTVAAVLIPQSMGYALLAGLPPVHGLYAALVGGIAGSLWGSSGFLATGPIAIVSLLTLTTAAQFAVPGSTEFIALVAALALMIGTIQIAFGLARLGYLVRLVPQSVLIGFSSASAIIIVLTQLPHLLGYPAGSNEFVFQMIRNAIVNGWQTSSLSALVGISALVIMFLLRRAYPKLPAPLLVLVGGIFLSFWLDLGAKGVELAGMIPARFPVTDIPMLSLELVLALGLKAFIIAIVGFMCSYAVVKEFSEKTRERVSADQELIGQGFANMFAGLFRGYPVGGSLSRTAVNYEAGAATAWSGVFASAIVALVIFLFSPVFAYIPNAIIAAIVIMAVIGLVDIPQMHRVHRVSQTDGMIAAGVFALALIFRPAEAILIGVVLALGLFLHRMMWADVTEVGVDSKWNVLRAIPENSSSVERFSHTLMLRINTSFFYANSDRLLEQMRSELDEYEARSSGKVRYLVLDCAGIDYMDATAAEGLGRFIDELERRSTTLCLIYTRREIRGILARSDSTKNVKMVHNIAELRAVCQGNDDTVTATPRKSRATKKVQRE